MDERIRRPDEPLLSAFSYSQAVATRSVWDRDGKNPTWFRYTTPSGARVVVTIVGSREAIASYRRNHPDAIDMGEVVDFIDNGRGRPPGVKEPNGAEGGANRKVRRARARALNRR